jgi:hypothetical protein
MIGGLLISLVFFYLIVWWPASYGVKLDRERAEAERKRYGF